MPEPAAPDIGMHRRWIGKKTIKAKDTEVYAGHRRLLGINRISWPGHPYDLKFAFCDT
jgi:hypothetical protein